VRRHALRAASLAALAIVIACGVACGGRETAGRDSRPADGHPRRIVLIVIDTLRRDHVSAYGGRVRTPNIDRLAAEGTRVDGAVSSFHQTTMSMAALFTGRTPSLESGDLEHPLGWTGRTWCGMARFADDASEALAEPEAGKQCVPSDLPTLAETLRRAGYRTVGIVSNPLLFEPAGYARGFDDWIQVGSMPREGGLTPTHGELRSRAAPSVLAAAEAALRRVGRERVFLYVHLMDVHDYFGGTEYADAVAVADGAVGRLRALLAGDGGLEDTVVVLTADHGERLGEEHVVSGMRAHYGNPSFETVLDVPLVVWPRLERVLPALVRGEDVYDLVLQLAGAASSREPVLAPDEQLISEQRFVTYRRGRWKSFFNRGTEVITLVDLEQDPGERRDVAGSHPDVVAAHRARLAELGQSLAAKTTTVEPLSEDDRRRLRALGYLQ
jgi:arylsulfatase A-like enzyme